MKKHSRPRIRKWHNHHLLDQDLNQRVSSIETLTKKVCWAPKTSFNRQQDHLVQIQEYIAHCAQRPQRQHILELANCLDAELTFLHGDLCRKNRVFDGKQLWVVDWEPSVKQIRKGSEQFLITEPYWAEDDRRNQCVTKKTDKLTFFFTTFKIVHQRDPLVYLREWIKVRQLRPVPMTPIAEDDLVVLSFTELIALVDQSAHWMPRLIFGEET